MVFVDPLPLEAGALPPPLDCGLHPRRAEGWGETGPCSREPDSTPQPGDEAGITVIHHGDGTYPWYISFQNNRNSNKGNTRKVPIEGPSAKHLPHLPDGQGHRDKESWRDCHSRRRSPRRLDDYMSRGVLDRVLGRKRALDKNRGI